MPKLKSALNLEGLKTKIREDLESSPTYLQGQLGKGAANSKTNEPTPDFAQSEAEKILENGSNAFVVLGNIFNIDGEIKSTIKTISIAFFQIGLFMIGYKFQLHTLMKLSLKPVIFAASIWIIII